jgi:hypothetical protein
VTRLKKRPGQVLKVVHDWAFQDLTHKQPPVRTEPVEVPEHPEPVEVLRIRRPGFNKLSPNGEGFVFCLFEFPIVLSLSKGRLNPNGEVGFEMQAIINSPQTPAWSWR